MNQLEEFSKLLAGLEGHVTELSRKDTQLAIEVNSKEARRVFLTKEIKELQVQREKQLDKHATALKKVTDDQKIADQQLADTKNEILRAEQQRGQRIKALDDKLVVSKDEIVKTDKQITDNHQIIADLKLKKTDLSSEIERLNKLVTNKKAEIQQEITDTQAKADQEIIRIDQEVEETNKELVELGRQIEAKTVEHNNLTKKNEKIVLEIKTGQEQIEGFKEYEKRARKALQARETALLQGENELVTKRRRTSVLDNMG